MRIISRASVSGFVLIFSSLAWSAPSTQINLPFFTPGTYQLISEDEERCGGGGEFEISADNNQFLHLGPKHVMATKEGRENRPSDLPGETHCHSESSDTIRYLGDSTIITQNAEDICAGKITYKLIRTVTIQKAAIQLKVEQIERQPDNTMKPINYTCSWKLKERSTSSTKSKKLGPVKKSSSF